MKHKLPESDVKDGNAAWPVTPARIVLDTQAVMHDLHAHPKPLLADFYRGFMTSVDDKKRQLLDSDSEGNVKRAGGDMLFYPLAGPHEAGKLCGIYARGFSEARTYQVTAEMVDAVNGMYLTTADKKVRHLNEGDVLSPSGFCWLDKPWAHKDMHGKLVSIRAALWQPQVVRWSYDREHEPSPEPTAGLRVTLFSMPGDPDDYWTDNAPVEDAIRATGPLSMLHTFVWPFEARFGSGGRYGGNHEWDDPLQWLHCLWLLLDSEIVTHRTEASDWQTRKRVLRSIRQHEVTVVTLRRAKHPAADDPDYVPQPVDWSCRWMVAGHWRHLDSYLMEHHHAMVSGFRGEKGESYCASCMARITWVKPHCKGPDGAPFRLTDKVYRLSR